MANDDSESAFGTGLLVFLLCYGCNRDDIDWPSSILHTDGDFLRFPQFSFLGALGHVEVNGVQDRPPPRFSTCGGRGEKDVHTLNKS